MAAGAGTSFAELSLDAAAWQSGKAEKPARTAVWSEVTETAFAGKKAPLLRGKAVIKNRGPKPAEGVLVRYVVAARIVPDNNVAAEAQWALPFLVDERRVPKIGANSVLEIPLVVSPKLELYFAKLKRLGFKPNSLKLQVMLEPHVDFGVRVVESHLGVAL